MLTLLSQTLIPFITGYSWDCPGHCGPGFHLTMVEDADPSPHIELNHPRTNAAALVNVMGRQMQNTEAVDPVRRPSPDTRDTMPVADIHVIDDGDESDELDES
jgi:hypothetical protein